MMLVVFLGLYMTLVTTCLTPSTTHPSEICGPKDVPFDDQFQDHDSSTCGAHHRNVNSKEIPYSSLKFPLEDITKKFLARTWQP